MARLTPSNPIKPKTLILQHHLYWPRYLAAMPCSVQCRYFSHRPTHVPLQSTPKSTSATPCPELTSYDGGRACLRYRTCRRYRVQIIKIIQHLPTMQHMSVFLNGYSWIVDEVRQTFCVGRSRYGSKLKGQWRAASGAGPNVQFS